MARLGSYQQDAQVDGQDKLIGTSSSNGQTSNYSIDSVGKYMAENNVIKLSNQISYKFIDSVSDIGDGTFFITGFNSDGARMDSVTSIVVCKKNGRGESVEKFIRKIFEDKVLVSSLDNQDLFCQFSINDISQHQTYSDFLTISLGSPEGDGVFSEDDFFSFSILSGSGDKKYVHSQEVNSTTWEINHGLNKNPSVTIVNSSNVQIKAEVEYIDLNNIEIRFVNSTSGKAYLN
jgi:hypothetical protein